MIIRIFSVLILSGVCAMGATMLHAAEILLFNENIPQSSLRKIQQFHSDSEHIDIAKIDLNGDGLHEFITRESACIRNQKCQFYILAENEAGITPLGSFTGYRLLPGNEFRNGVRNLVVYNNPLNDFDYTLYTWHAESSSYRVGTQ